MKTYIKSKVYEIRQSSKGWSGIYQLFFDKAKALAEAERLNEESKTKQYKTNFRVYEHTTGDLLVYRDE